MSESKVPASGALGHVAEQFRLAFAQHGRSPAAVLVPKGRQDLRFHAISRHIERDGFSILDYGCGLADLKGYLDGRFLKFSYTGTDLVGEFIEDNRRNYPDASFAQLASPDGITEEFDYIALSGIFNILYVPDVSEHKRQVQAIIETLFKRCRVALSVSFMTDCVDYQQAGAYHQNPAELHNFLTQHLSPRLVIDQSYMPYEFTATVFRNANIVRPANIYDEDAGAHR